MSGLWIVDPMELVIPQILQKKGKALVEFWWYANSWKCESLSNIFRYVQPIIGRSRWSRLDGFDSNVGNNRIDIARILETYAWWLWVVPFETGPIGAGGISLIGHTGDHGTKFSGIVLIYEDGLAHKDMHPPTRTCDILWEIAYRYFQVHVILHQTIIGQYHQKRESQSGIVHCGCLVESAYQLQVCYI